MDAPDPSPPPPASPPVRRVVVVLGMHRSGTSAVAGCLLRLGVDFGPRLMPATPDNPRGYYEHVDLVNLHDRLLLALGRSWDDTFPFPADWWCDEAVTGRFREDATGLLQRDFPAAPLWGFKDPRLCHLLPWWKPLWREMNSEPLFVIVRRPPLEVAASLARREGFSAGKSHLLWLQHVLEAERHTRGCARVIIDFKTFVADWRGGLEPVRRLLDQPWPHAVVAADAPETQFVDPGLLRSTLDEETLEQAPLWLQQSDSALQMGMAGRETEMQLVLDAVAEQFHAAEWLSSPEQNGPTADLRLQLDAIRKQAAWYEAEWQKTRRRLEDARAKLSDKRTGMERLEYQPVINEK